MHTPTDLFGNPQQPVSAARQQLAERHRDHPPQPITTGQRVVITHDPEFAALNPSALGLTGTVTTLTPGSTHCTVTFDLDGFPLPWALADLRALTPG